MTINPVQETLHTLPIASSTASPLTQLPMDLIVLLFQNLRDKDISSTQQTCKTIYQLLQDDNFWKHRLSSLFSSTIPEQKNYQSTYKQFCSNLKVGRFTRYELQGHKDDITSLLIINDHIFASGSMDSTIKIWDLTSYRCLVTLEGHQKVVSCLVAHNNHLLSGSWDNTIKIWDLNNHECIATLEGHLKQISSFAMHQNMLLSGSDDKTIKIWNLETQQCVFTLEGHEDCISCLAVYKNMLLSGSRDTTIKIWNLETKECVGTLNSHQKPVSCLLVAGDQLFSGSWDKTIKIWDLETKKCVATLNNYASDLFDKDETEILRYLHYSRFTTAEWMQPKIQNVIKGYLNQSKALTGDVTSLELFHDKLICGTQGQRIYVWDVKTQKCLYTVGVKTEINRLSAGAISCFASYKGQLFSAASKMSNPSSAQTIRIWDFASAALDQNLMDKQ